MIPAANRCDASLCSNSSVSCEIRWQIVMKQSLNCYDKTMAHRRVVCVFMCLFQSVCVCADETISSDTMESRCQRIPFLLDREILTVNAFLIIN